MSDIKADVDRVETALGTPTLKLLNGKYTAATLALFSSVFSQDVQSIPVDRFHTVIDVRVQELRASAYSRVPPGNGKELARSWVDDHWLYRDPGRGQESYQLTGAAKSAIDYVARATRSQLNVSASRIETMCRVVSDAALTASPDREERKRRLHEEIARLQEEYDHLDGGGDMPEASESDLTEQFSNVLRELEGMPSDFRRVEEAVREMQKTLVHSFRDDKRLIGEVVDDYLDQADNLLTSTPEGRAFKGALDLLRRRDLLASLRTDLETILAHPWADTLTTDEQRQLRGAVLVIRQGISDVLGQRKRATATLREHIENYDFVGNKALDEVLTGAHQELRQWMQTAKPRDHIEVELIPQSLDIEMLRTDVFDPNTERVPEALASGPVDVPDPPTLEELRAKGGPSLERLNAEIERLLGAGDVPSAAELFEGLPGDLKRPVEIIGLLRLFTRRDAAIDSTVLQEITAVRPDGSTRRFALPVVRLTSDAAQQEEQG